MMDMASNYLYGQSVTGQSFYEKTENSIHGVGGYSTSLKVLHVCID